jgi:hypothetical protein
MTEQPKYVCWAEHAEDLTAVVNREREHPGEWTLRHQARKGDTSGQDAKTFQL